MTWLVNQNPVSDQRYNKFPGSDPMLNYHKHNLWMAFVDFLFDYDEKVASS